VSARNRANVEMAVLSRLKVWIAQLPDEGTELEIEKPLVNGEDLHGVRCRSAAIEAEISAISSAPMPPSREHFDNYVAQLARAGRPAFRNGEIWWPARRTRGGLLLLIATAHRVFSPVGHPTEFPRDSASSP
jgi:hypothetical protein